MSGFGSEKVFDSGDKLFELSCEHPVAAMVNGNLDFLGVPWEIIIKEFRDKPTNPVPTSIEEWGKAFIDVVIAHRAVNERESLSWLRNFARTELAGITTRAFKDVREKLSGLNQPDAAETIAQSINADLTGRLEVLRQSRRITSLENLDEAAVREAVAPIVAQERAAHFPAMEDASELAVKLLDVIVWRILTDLTSDYATGIVVAGFASDDLFPSLYAISIDGVICGRVRYDVTHKVEITRDDADQPGTTKELGTAISFAQTDVINRLLRGADERFISGSKEFFVEAVQDTIKRIFADLELRITSPGGDVIDVNNLALFLGYQLPDLYETNAVKKIGDQIEKGFKQTIALMPKQEMIELAEALVSITAIERKATDDAGTVGGPIDVALITRSEGFVWIKRKHHFKADLNPRYMSRVFGQRRGGGEA